MAQFTLATKTPGRSGSSGGLRPSFLSPNTGGNLATTRIAPGAGRVTFTPSPIPKAVEDVTSKVAQNFMAVTAEAAFRYQERESDFFGNQAALDLDKYLAKEYNGFENEDGSFTEGMIGSEGADSIRAYNQFEKDADELYSKVLSGLEPRVQQKAILKMQASKNRYITKAATHRAQQIEVAEDRQRLDTITGMESTFIKDPSVMSGIDPVLKTTGKERHDALFQNTLEAKASWSSVVHNTAKGIYQEHAVRGSHSKGISVVKGYYDSIAKTYLADDSATRMALQTDITRWEKAALSQEVQAFNYANAKDAENRRVKQEAGALKFDEQIASGVEPEADDLFKAREHGDISQTRYDIYMRRFHSSITDRPEAFDSLRTDIEQNNIQTVEQLKNDPRAKYISGPNETFLSGYIAEVKKPSHGGRLTTGNRLVDNLFRDASFMGDINEQTLSNHRNDMKVAMADKLTTPGVTPQQAIIELIPLYSPARIRLDSIPGISMGDTVRRPESLEDAGAMVTATYNSMQRGELTDYQYYSAMLTLAKYRQHWGALNAGTRMEINPEKGTILNDPNTSSGSTATPEPIPTPAPTSDTSTTEDSAKVSTEETDSMVESITQSPKEVYDKELATISSTIPDAYKEEFDNYVEITTSINNSKPFSTKQSIEDIAKFKKFRDLSVADTVADIEEFPVTFTNAEIADELVEVAKKESDIARTLPVTVSNFGQRFTLGVTSLVKDFVDNNLDPVTKEALAEAEAKEQVNWDAEQAAKTKLWIAKRSESMRQFENRAANWEKNHAAKLEEWRIKQAAKQKERDIKRANKAKNIAMAKARGQL